MFVFFTELIRREVIDRHNRWIGWPHDFVVDFSGAYPPLTGLTVATGHVRKQFAFLPWNQIHITHHQGKEAFQVRLPLESLQFTPAPPKPVEPSLRRDILDQQVVDTYNRKLVRVNDIHLLRVDSSFRIAHVDVGIRGIVRRLGWEPVIDRLLRFVHPHARYLNREGFIAWKYVQPLVRTPGGKIPITLSHSEIDTIPPADLGEILQELDAYQRAALFKALDPDMQGEVLAEMAQRFRKELIADLDMKTAVAVLEQMPPDEATDILQDLPRSERTRFLSSLSSRKAQKLSALLTHHEDSAGGLMTTEFIRLPITCTVGEAIEHIRAMTGVAETIYYAYLVDEQQHLEGVVNFRALLVEPLHRPILEVMTPRPTAVEIHDSAKAVAFTLDKYNLFAVPVIDAERILHGIITVDDILSVVIEEAWGEKSGLM